MNYMGNFGQVGGITYSAADYSYPGQSGLGQFNLTPENKKMLIYAGVGAGIFILLLMMKRMPDSVEVRSNPKKHKLSRRQLKDIKKLWSKWENEDEDHIPPIPR